MEISLGTAHIGDGLALVQELIGSPQFADDLYSFREAFGYGVWRLRFMGLLLARSGRLGSSDKHWISFWGPRQATRSAATTPLVSASAASLQVPSLVLEPFHPWPFGCLVLPWLLAVGAGAAGTSNLCC